MHFLALCTLCSSTYIKNAKNVQLCAIHHVCTRFARFCAFFMSSTHSQRYTQRKHQVYVGRRLNVASMSYQPSCVTLQQTLSLLILIANNKQCCFLLHETFIFILSFIHYIHSFFIFVICALTMHEHVVVFNRIFFIFIFHYNENFMHPHEIVEIVNFRQNPRKNAVFWPGAGLLVIQTICTFTQLFLGISFPNS